MYLSQVALYEISLAVNQLVRGMFNPRKVHTDAAKEKFWCLAWTVGFSST